MAQPLSSPKWRRKTASSAGRPLLDAFAVSAAVAAGLAELVPRHVFRLAWHFGLFQTLMTLLGWVGGEGLSQVMFGMNYVVAAGILLVLGAKMIYESGDHARRTEGFDPTRGWSLVALSVATSLDAMAVGVSLSLIGVVVWRPALLIGLLALVMSYTGAGLGKQWGERLGNWAERVGGLVLIAIGAKIAAQYLLG